MFFDLAPKSKREDLYDFEYALEMLSRGVEAGRIVAVLAPRRYGKSSVLKTFLNESGHPYIFVDARRILASEGLMNVRGFMVELSNAITRLIRERGGAVSRLLDLFRGIDGVEISSSSLRLSWSRRKRADMPSILDRIDEWASQRGLKVVVAFDEFQELKPLPLKFPHILAYIYDNLPSIVVIITGSQIGLLYDMLNLDDPRSPLYGRAIYEVRLRRLRRDEALDFLRRGFAQTNTEVDEAFLSEAVEKLDGIIGWLTYLGWYASSTGTFSIDVVLEKASRQAVEELMGFLKVSRSERRYRIILKSLAEGPLRWGEVKRILESREGMEVDGKNLTVLLRRLMDLGFVERAGGAYLIPDPILRIGVKIFL